ncbi:hypothetical protein PCE1_000016 [Barthelona sp. PCE]
MGTPQQDLPPAPRRRLGTKRGSICDNTLIFRNINSSTLEGVIQFCMHIYVHEDVPDAGFFNQSIDLIDLLLAASYFEISDLVLYVSKMISTHLILDESVLRRLPTDLAEEIIVAADPISLFDRTCLTSDHYRILCYKHFNIMLSSPENNIDDSNSPQLFPDSPIPSVQKYIVKHTTPRSIEMDRSLSVSPWVSETPQLLTPKKNINMSVDQLKSLHADASFNYKTLFFSLTLEYAISSLSAVPTNDELSKIRELMLVVSPLITKLTVVHESADVVSSITTVALEILSELVWLDISKNRLTKNSISPIIDALINSNIYRLNVGNNRLAVDGARELARFITSSSHLSVLHAEHNCLGPEGVRVLSFAISKSTSIRKVSIGYNQARPSGAHALYRSLYDHHTLEVLDIGTNYFGDVGAGYIAKLIESNTSLRYIRVWDSSMSENGGHHLVRALEKNYDLIDLGLGQSSLSQADSEHLQLLLRRNRDASLKGTLTFDEYSERRSREVRQLYGADSVFSDIWYIIDEKWLSKWRSFVAPNSTKPPPGPITNSRLVNYNGEIRPGLKKLSDYRGLCPQVYYLFVEIYGIDGPTIVRTNIDIYQE